MPQLLVRSVDEDLIDRLKERAVAHQRSAEEEHRQILRQVLRGPTRRSLAQVLKSIPAVGIDADFERRD